MMNALFCAAETSAGRVQGVVNAGVAQFKGVPYGAPTGGANRFMAPVKPTPWAGVRNCFGYGQMTPQLPVLQSLAYGQLIGLDLAIGQGGLGEDCLNLNVWTPGLDDGGRRPVMVLIHGGGFHHWSANAGFYDGAQLARSGEVVVVSVNHRLSSFGFLNLADAGAPAQFAAAGAAGVLDLVAALEWVRENIVGFGGDPGKVTIFGQSGGGWKVSTLLATPAASGLYHRAVVQSGSLLRLQTRDAAAAVAARFLGELGLTKATLGKIQELPWQMLLEAQKAVGELNFIPVLDGVHLPHHPFDPAAPEESADVPLIVSTTLDDAGLFYQDFDLDEAALLESLKAKYGKIGPEMLHLYRRRWPEKTPYLLQAQIVTDAGFRRFAYAQAELKAGQGRAPVYLYQWDWATPAFDGRYGAAHAADVAASLGNAREAIVGAGSAGGRRLCDAMSASLCAFARTGDPNTATLPHWPPFERDRRPTMIFDEPIRLEHDPNPHIRAFWAEMPPSASVFA